MKYLQNVATIKVIQEKCTGCEMCMKVCPRNVLTIIEKKAVIADKDSCIECGACAMNCAFDAISGDFGVGCATAMINGLIRFGNPDKGSCGCDADDKSGGCC